jgi:phospholipase C
MPFGESESGKVWDFAVKERDPLQYEWTLDQVKGDIIEMDVHGPNGFFRMFKLHRDRPHNVVVKQDLKRGTLGLVLEKLDKEYNYVVKDRSYGSFRTFLLDKSFSGTKMLDFTKSYGWYDLEITCQEDSDLCLVFAGHIENGMPSKTDPLMGDVINHS